MKEERKVERKSYLILFLTPGYPGDSAGPHPHTQNSDNDVAYLAGKAIDLGEEWKSCSLTEKKDINK